MLLALLSKQVRAFCHINPIYDSKLSNTISSFRSQQEEEHGKQRFIQQAMLMEQALSQTSGPFFLEDLSVVDCVFLPYVERMNASLFYYKGFTLRDPQAFPKISAWFDGLESRSTYRGTQSDFHTHCHDLPPQMGGKFL